MFAHVHAGGQKIARTEKLFDLEVIKTQITQTAINTRVFSTIALSNFALTEGTRSCLELWGYHIFHGSIDPDTVNVNASYRFGLSTSNSVTSIILPNDPGMIFAFEEAWNIPATASATSVVHFTTGMPQGMWPVPICVAADNLFAHISTTAFTALEDTTACIYARPRVVSRADYYDVVETFRA